MKRRLAVSAAPKEEPVLNGCKTVHQPFGSISDAHRRQQWCVKCWMSFLCCFLVCTRPAASDEWLIVTTAVQRENMRDTYPAWLRPDHWRGYWHPGGERGPSERQRCENPTQQVAARICFLCYFVCSYFPCVYTNRWKHAQKHSQNCQFTLMSLWIFFCPCK